LHCNRWAATVAPVDHAVTPLLGVFDQTQPLRRLITPLCRCYEFLIKLFLKKFVSKRFL
jgi:hypothetical protein